jgi:flagellar protein FliS
MMTQYDAYRKTTIDTSDSVQIVSLLLDGAVNFMKAARVKIEQNDIAGKGVCIGKATAIISELMAALNMEEGGEIASNLKRLYEFVLDRLFKANIHRDVKSIDEALTVLENIRAGWKEMERNRAQAHSASMRASMGVGMAV